MKFLLLLAFAALGCTRQPKPPAVVDQAHAQAIAERCKQWIGERRIESFGSRVWGAFGYDLANAYVIKTSAGNVFVDAGLSPARSQKMYEDLTAKSPGRTYALILTHSHLDHVGGAGVFTNAGSEIWASQAFETHFLKQYGVFQPIEMIRGARQYGAHVPDEILPCTSIGPKPDLVGAFQSQARMPTHVFENRKDLEIGGVRITLFEAHGETHDQIMVWLPDDRILFAGDNIYKAFPNLYTIRGTSPRPVDDWIRSLDHMRQLEPEILLPSHTGALVGKALVQETLTAYRDGIQWVRDATVRGANAGLSANTLAETVKLPSWLAAHPYLQEDYGQVDWSVRAIYSDNLGWFAGEPDRLHPLTRRDASKREIGLMGGPESVLEVAQRAYASSDFKWAIHLLAKLRESGLATGALSDRTLELLSQAYGKLALETSNTNGRGYLAESAAELTERLEPLGRPNPDAALIQAIPIDVFLAPMGARLKLADTDDVHETLVMSFSDLKREFYLTIRRGVLEVAPEKPLPGTPKPFATVTVDSMTWKRLALKQENAAAAVASGKIQVQGSWLQVGKFLKRFKVD